MAKGDLGNPRVTVTSPNARQGAVSKIAGLDHCVYPDGRTRPDSDELSDDFVQGGVTIKNAPGGPYGSGR